MDLSDSDQNDSILHNGFEQLLNGQEPYPTMLYRKQSFESAWIRIETRIHVIWIGNKPFCSSY